MKLVQGRLKGRFLEKVTFIPRWNAKNHSWRVAELLKPMTVRLRWTRDNATVFESISFSGYVGVLTAVKKASYMALYNKKNMFSPQNITMQRLAVLSKISHK